MQNSERAHGGTAVYNEDQGMCIIRSGCFTILKVLDEISERMRAFEKQSLLCAWSREWFSLKIGSFAVNVSSECSNGLTTRARIISDRSRVVPLKGATASE